MSRDKDMLSLPTPPGTRDLYRKVARLTGKSFKDWCRESLREAAAEVLKQHGMEIDPNLPVHLPRPKRLQPQIKFTIPARDEEEP